MTSDSQFEMEYQRLVRALVNRHLETVNNGNRRQPPSIAHELDSLPIRLPASLRNRILGLEEDLALIRNSPGGTHGASTTSAATAEVIQDAVDGEQWDEALAGIRGGLRLLTQTQVQQLRFQIWTGLGFPEAAECFAQSPVALRSLSEAPAGPKFKAGQTVELRATLEMVKIVEEATLDAGEYWYRIRRSGGSIANVVEDAIDVERHEEDSIQALACNGKWGLLRAVRCAMAIERIQDKSSRSNLYSFKSQRVLFQPYQYKPLLKVLDSPDRRLLIADEVGLGKTIEAGLVLTELQARGSLSKVLVVCPSRLREKWRNELNRKFGESFEIYDKKLFLAAAARHQEAPQRHPLRAILSINTARLEDVRDCIQTGLGQFDMVVVDEAHHARNRQTGAAKLLRELCEQSDCVLLLTATPIQLRSEDLFNLLNALRPAEFLDPHGFEAILEQHAPIHEASTLARTQNPAELPRIDSILTDVFLADSADEPDPKALQVLQDIRERPPVTRRDWVDLERRIQDLHPLGTIVTRTRKRDVQLKAPVRRSRTLTCDWTVAEQEAYQRLVGNSDKAGWFRSEATLGQVQRARQAASCLPAALNETDYECDDDLAAELTDILPSELKGLRDDRSSARGPQQFRGVDSKFQVLVEILSDVRSTNPNAKVLIFTFFRATARYLEKQLTKLGWNTLRIDGDVKSDPRRPERDDRGQRIDRFQNDPSVTVMVSTEVGSEGLDFQFCHHLVNYDLPWNPMVVEQRIGRIDRFGQEQDCVYIHNLVVTGTVEERILERLYSRIGIFERSIGNLEAILGETVRELQRDYVMATLKPDEAARRLQEAEDAVVRQGQHLESLESKAAELFGHEEFIRDEMTRVSKYGRYITANAYVALLETYFASNHPRVRLHVDEENECFVFRMSEDLRRDIVDASRGTTLWFSRASDDRFRFTTSGDTAFRHKQLELVNAAHPLVKAALKAIAPRFQSASARIGKAIVNRSLLPQSTVNKGVYFLLLFAHKVTSLRSRQILEAVACNATDLRILDAEESEQLLHVTIEQGQEWDSAIAAPAMPQEAWDALISEARRRNRRLREAEARENGALFTRRLKALKADHERKLEAARRRLETAKANNRSSILPAMTGQIDKLEADFRAKAAELRQAQTVEAPMSDAIAACVIFVRED
jgi:SNF2 family DNA or RNA helicase